MLSTMRKVILYIYKKKPKLNDMSSAMPLLVIKFFFFFGIHDTQYLYIRLIFSDREEFLIVLYITMDYWNYPDGQGISTIN